MIYSIIDKPQALLPAKNEIMHEFEFCIPLLYKYPYMCVISTCLLLPRLGGAFDLRLAVSVPLPIVMGIFVLLWFQSRLT